MDLNLARSGPIDRMPRVPLICSFRYHGIIQVHDEKTCQCAERYLACCIEFAKSGYALLGAS